MYPLGKWLALDAFKFKRRNAISRGKMSFETISPLLATFKLSRKKVWIWACTILQCNVHIKMNGYQKIYNTICGVCTERYVSVYLQLGPLYFWGNFESYSILNCHKGQPLQSLKMSQKDVVLCPFLLKPRKALTLSLQLLFVVAMVVMVTLLACCCVCWPFF